MVAGMKVWKAVTVTTPAGMADSLGSFLLDHGAPGLVTEESAGWVTLTAHFPGEPPLAEIEIYLSGLHELFPAMERPTVALQDVCEESWADNWKENFPPLCTGERLFVHPPWVKEVPPGREGILIDPGMAFGTGQHASTRGCLVLLECAMGNHPGARVLDVGTGSGILAIAAAKLGSGDVWAVDIDPDACAVARENAEVNGVADVIHVGASLDAVPGRFDILLANLFAPQLVEFTPRFVSLLRGNATVIGSGILAEEADAVCRAWTAAGLTETGRHREDEWVTLAFRR